MSRFKSLFFLALGASLLSACENKVSLPDEFAAKMGTVAAAELGLVEYTVSKVVKADDKADWMNFKFGDRKILFSVKGKLKAGLDLASPNAYSAEIDEQTKSIVLNLPMPKILSFDLKAEDTKLEYEQVSKTRFDFTNEERNLLLRQGEKAILDDAENLGILKDAQANGKMFFSSMLAQLGFTNVTINYSEK